MADIAWILPTPSSGGYFIDNPARSGGVSFSGAEQTVVSMQQRWRCTWNVSIRNTAQALEARAFFGLANGRAGNILVPDFNTKGVNWPSGPPFLPSSVTAVVAAAAALHATTIQIDVTAGAPLKRGQHFSIAHRLYRINALSGSGPYTCEIMPPLRAAAAAGATVNLSRPICLMCQATDDQGLKGLDVMQFADLQLEFVEALP